MCVMPSGTHSQKVLYVVALHSKYTGALAFENGGAWVVQVVYREAKETYYIGNRDLEYRQKRPRI
jgi:hypothetical protein